jgi:hypothetical protein
MGSLICLPCSACPTNSLHVEDYRSGSLGFSDCRLICSAAEYLLGKKGSLIKIRIVVFSAPAYLPLASRVTTGPTFFDPARNAYAHKKFGSLRLEPLSWFFRPRESLQSGVIAEQIRREWEAAGWGSDPRFSDRQFAKVLLRALGDLYPGDHLEKVLQGSGEFVMQARSNQSGRILSWSEVKTFAAEQNQNQNWGGGRDLALRLTILCQTADGFSWELLDPVGHK